MFKKISLLSIVLTLVLPVSVLAQQPLTITPVILELQTYGKPEGYSLGQRFNINKDRTRFNYSIRNVSGNTAKDVVVTWIVQPESVISFNPLCTGSAKLFDIYGYSYGLLPGVVENCPAFLAGGHYSLILKVTSASIDDATGQPVELTKIVPFDVFPLPQFQDLSITGNITVKRTGKGVENPDPVDSQFFVGDKFAFPRDARFEYDSAKLITGTYNSGIYNASKEDYPDLAIRYELRRPNGLLHCEAIQTGLYLSSGGLWTDFINAGYLVPGFYFQCDPFNQRGKWTLTLQAWRTSKPEVKAIATREIIVGSTASYIPLMILENPKIPAGQAAPVSKPSAGTTIVWTEAPMATEKSINNQPFPNAAIPPVVSMPPIPITSQVPRFGADPKVKAKEEARQKDTDGDGLSDVYEQTVSKTDPYNKDTDSDGYLDGTEVATGYDPLVNVKTNKKVTVSKFTPKAASAKQVVVKSKAEKKVVVPQSKSKKKVIWY
ncbi:MAG: hypothetical protein V1707_02555 [bacterium]